jgi:hypothetical protein
MSRHFFASISDREPLISSSPMGRSFAVIATRSSLFAFLVCTIVGTFLRGERLIHDPLWHDEILSIVRMDGGNKATFVQLVNSNRSLTGDSLRSFIESSQQGPERGRLRMPGFYLLEKVFSFSLVSSRIGAKFFSFLCGSLLPLAVALLVSQLSKSILIPPLVTLFVALNPMLIAYSVEARPYAALLLLLTSYLCLLIGTSSLGPRGWFGFGIVTVVGAFMHLLFLPVAWLGFLLQTVLVTDSRSRRKRTLGILVLASLAALPWVLSVLGAPEASAHFTRNAVMPETLMTSANDLLLALLGIDLSHFPYLGFGFLLFTLLVIVWTGSPQTRVVMLSLSFPFLVLFSADLVLGGIRSTVPRYSLTMSIAFSLALAHMLGNIGQRYRLLSLVATVFIIGAQYAFRFPIEYNLKGGRYEELAWYTRTFGAQEVLVLSMLPGNRSIEFAANSFSSSGIIPVSGFLSPAVVAQTTTALGRGIPVLSITSLDAMSPMAPGPEFRWEEEFVGAQTVIYRLGKRENLD